MINGEILLKINVEFMFWVSSFVKCILYSGISHKIDTKWYGALSKLKNQNGWERLLAHKTPSYMAWRICPILPPYIKYEIKINSSNFYPQPNGSSCILLLGRDQQYRKWVERRENALLAQKRGRRDTLLSADDMVAVARECGM